MVVTYTINIIRDSHNTYVGELVLQHDDNNEGLTIVIDGNRTIEIKKNDLKEVAKRI
jgi:hypothetical protein